ncbi:hypothetical protein EBBID32_32470 [Sphingobium indicum BiD32]|uniref:Uncharacterized protein n=1 Tax=Sphingobium indicum BiD32 TaxID=1301087 RepID=N1MNS8_9SPHN|nr:hypothetical protein EBBID32_32470 [Sphingobium indicum BiD32]
MAKLRHCAPIAGVIGPVSRIANGPPDKMTMAVTPPRSAWKPDGAMI